MTIVKINNSLNVVKKIQTSNLQIGDFIIKQDNDCLIISKDSHVLFTISKNDLYHFLYLHSLKILYMFLLCFSFHNVIY